MPPFTSSRPLSSDDQFNPRFRHVAGRMLDSIEHELDRLAAFDAPAMQRAAIVEAVWARCAPLLCCRTRCRRARRCQRNPCVAPGPRDGKVPAGDGGRRASTGTRKTSLR